MELYYTKSSILSFTLKIGKLLPRSDPFGKNCQEMDLLSKKRKVENSAAEKASRKIQTLEEILTCPVCLETFRMEAIYQCVEGHGLCSGCSFLWDFKTCPICRGEKSVTRDLTAQKAIEILMRGKTIHCKFKDSGCNWENDYNLTSLHEKACRYRITRCPAYYSSQKCLWKGRPREVFVHSRQHTCFQVTDYTGYVLPDITLFKADIKSQNQILLLDDPDIFPALTHMHITKNELDETYEILVRALITAAFATKIKYRITLWSANGKRQILETVGNPRSIEEAVAKPQIRIRIPDDKDDYTGTLFKILIQLHITDELLYVSPRVQ